MLFSTGTKVRLIHTGDEGTVAEWLEHDLVAVRLWDGSVIPVLKTAIERVDVGIVSGTKAKFVQGKKKAEPLPFQPLTADSQYLVLKPQGVQLAFDPVKLPDGMPDHYRMFLINDTARNFLYQLNLQLHKAQVWGTQGRLGPRTMIEVGSLRYAELNESPMVHLEAWRLLPDGKGTGRRLSKELKLKATQFFDKITTAPYLNRQVYLYAIFSEKELNEERTPPPAAPKESLKAITTEQVKQKKANKKWHNLQEMPHEVWELASFDNEIDLHLEALVKNPAKIPANQILSTQLQHFDQYMARAIRLGKDRVFIIHGLGEGKLRDAVHARLAAMPDVKSYNNDYHPRYGYGATEVVL